MHVKPEIFWHKNKQIKHNILATCMKQDETKQWRKYHTLRFVLSVRWSIDWQSCLTIDNLTWLLTILTDHWQSYLTIDNLTWLLTILPDHWQSCLTFDNITWPLMLEADIVDPDLLIYNKLYIEHCLLVTLTVYSTPRQLTVNCDNWDKSHLWCHRQN